MVDVREEEDSRKTIIINYVKSFVYREIACDGALGGPTPQKKLWVAFYTERYPLPKEVEQSLIKTAVPHEFELDNSVPPVVIDSKKGLVRNVEFGVYLSLDSAERLYTWLGANIESLKAIK
jgi:hypothetical protein